MKIFLLSFLLMGNTFAKGGCFLDPIINQLAEIEQKKPCAEFPEMTTVRNLVENDKGLEGKMTFYQQDFDRMPELYQIAVKGVGSGLQITLKGKISLKRMGHFYLNGLIHPLNGSEGEFDFANWIAFGINYQPVILKYIREARYLRMTAGPDEVMDFKGLYPRYGMEIKGGKEIRNFNPRGERDANIELEGTAEQKLILKDSKIDTDDLTLTHVQVDSIKNDWRIRKSLELTNVDFNCDLLIDSFSEVRSLKLLNTKVNFVSDDWANEDEEGKPRTPLRIFNHAVIVNVQNSQISGVSLPSFSGVMWEFTVHNSQVEMEHMPDFPQVKTLILSGKVTIKNQEYPLRIHEKMEGLNLTDLNLKVINLELVDPKNFWHFYFQGNPKAKINLVKSSGLEKLPTYFMMVVQTGEQAKLFRRIFDRRAVASVEWLPQL